MENKFFIKVKDSLTKEQIEKFKFDLNNNPLIVAEPMEVVRIEKSINEFCNEAYEIAKSKGWHDTKREVPELIALIHSEVSEALEADRKDDYDNFKEELADVCIRIFDLCGSMDIDLNEAIEKKMEKNRKRPYKHGKKY